MLYRDYIVIVFPYSLLITNKLNSSHDSTRKSCIVNEPLSLGNCTCSLSGQAFLPELSAPAAFTIVY